MDLSQEINQLLDNDKHFFYMTNICFSMLVVLIGLGVTILIVQMRSCHNTRAVHKMVKTNQILIHRLLNKLAPFSQATDECRREHGEIIEAVGELNRIAVKLLYENNLKENEPKNNIKIKNKGSNKVEGIDYNNQVSGDKIIRRKNKTSSLSELPTINI